MPAPVVTSRPDSSPVYLTVPEVAELLRTTKHAVYAMARRQRLPGVRRPGRRLLVNRAELLAWLERAQ
jgi:excisionase family DNA binding protein